MRRHSLVPSATPVLSIALTLLVPSWAAALESIEPAPAPPVDPAVSTTASTEEPTSPSAPPPGEPGDPPEGSPSPEGSQGVSAAGEGEGLAAGAAEAEAVGAAEAEAAPAAEIDREGEAERAEPITAAASASPEVAEERHAWTKDLSFGAFVDAYVGFNTNLPRPQAGTNAIRAFDAANGFSLAWAGLNTAYEGERAGATIDLRFGAAPNAGWADDAIPGIQHVKQAYATWHALPEGKLSLDFGRFDTIYGAEVAESWMNHTYTRGALYNLAQPFWHTGLRVGSQVTDVVSITGLLVNGWGHVFDNNMAKSVGLQVGLTPGDVFGIYIGYLGGAESDDVDPETGAEIAGANWDLRHLADVVVTADLNKLSLALNADYVLDDTPVGMQQWYGAMLSAHYQALSWFGFAARGEFLADPDGFMSGESDNFLATGTVSLDFMPAEMLSLRLDARGDGSLRPLFPTGSALPGLDEELPMTPEMRQFQLTVTLGMVVHSF